MIEINLLPKDYLKSSRSFSLGKTGFYVAAGAVGLVLLMAGITIYQTYQLAQLDENIDKARQRAAVLKKDIELVDALTDIKKKITDRMVAVEKLDRHRSAYVRVMEEVTRDVPEFVWLASFREIPQEKKTTTTTTKNRSGITVRSDQPAQDTTQTVEEVGGPASVRPVEVEGYAFTLNALAALMINMMRSDYFDNVELVSTNEKKFQDRERAYNFVLTCDVHYLTEEELQNLLAQADNTEDEAASASHRSLN